TEYRAVLEEGALSVQPPPLGVGRYEQSETLHAAHERQLWDLARWRVHLGTWDDARYPTVTINLARNPGLVDIVAVRDSGDALQIINPPPWLPPDPIELQIEGYEERLGPYTWEVTFNASSGGPLLVGVIADPDGDVGPQDQCRADTAGAELAADANATQTTFTVRTTRGPRWVTTAEEPGAFPVDMLVGGELVRVTSISGTGTTQTLIVHHATNGRREYHAAGTGIRLFRGAIVVLRGSQNRMYMWNAGALIAAEKLSPKILTGEVLIQFNEPVSDYYRGTVTITFPQGFFTETPMVLLTPRTTVPGTFITVG